MTDTAPSVAVLILNWNGLDDTLECLQSLRESTYAPLRIIVWDNGSREDPGPALAAFPEVTLLRSDENIGFAGGCNRAAEHALAAGCDFLLFLNNDTLVPPDMIATMVRAHQEMPRAGLVGVPERLYDHPDDPRRLGAKWLPLSCRVKWIYGRAGEPPALREAGPDDPADEAGGTPARSCVATERELDVISGCAMLMPAALARDVGLFDETFFAYWEDADLSLRVQQAGYANLCATGTHVTHRSGRSTGRQPGFSKAQLYLVCRGQAVMARKHARGLGRLTAPLRLWLSAMAAGLSGFVRPASRKLMLAKIAAFTDGWSGRPVDKFWLS